MVTSSGGTTTPVAHGSGPAYQEPRIYVFPDVRNHPSAQPTCQARLTPPVGGDAGQATPLQSRSGLGINSTR